jgi:hypothetical protein
VIGSLLLLDKIDCNLIKEAYLKHDMSNESLRSLGEMQYSHVFALKQVCASDNKP